MTTKVDEMFKTDLSDVKSKAKNMAEFIAVEDEELEKLQSTLTERKANLDQVKEDLAMLMVQNGIEKLTLDNGLSPKAVTKAKFYKAQGVSDEDLHQWLNQIGLGDIIKPYVYFNTLQAALKEYNGDVPDTLINRSEVKTVTMYGKSKFLNNRNTAESSAA